jgi:Spy/CpxP family protein refolding chaperone
LSYGVQSAGLFGSSSQANASSGISLRPFANLDLTEDQRKQIRSILKTADSEGLSTAEIQQEINAILTPAQQSTLQGDLSSLSNSTSSSTSSSTTSSSTQSTQSAPPPPPGGNPFTDPNGPFANLDLSADQQSQIAAILKNGQSQGLTLDQINAQIDAVLTTSQQATFTTDLQDLPPPPGSQGSSSASDPLSNLGLTDDQKSKIETILQNAQADGTSQADVLTQIEAVLTPTQQSAFLQDVQTAQAIVSGQSQSGSGGTSSSPTSTLSSALTETDVQNQIAAATSLILQQFQHDVSTAA